jgi:hypothetical protein
MPKPADHKRDGVHGLTVKPWCAPSPWLGWPQAQHIKTVTQTWRKQPCLGLLLLPQLLLWPGSNGMLAPAAGLATACRGVRKYWLLLQCPVLRGSSLLCQPRLLQQGCVLLLGLRADCLLSNRQRWGVGLGDPQPWQALLHQLQLLWGCCCCADAFQVDAWCLAGVKARWEAPAGLWG